MNRRSAVSFDYRSLLRRAGLIAAVSLALAVALIGFVFGVSNEFFSRVAGAFFVFFWLISVTFLGVVPFISWAATHWFGQSWTDQPAEPKRKPRTTTAAAATVRKGTRTVSRSEEKQ